MLTQIHLVTFHENKNPNQFRWEAHCTCNWCGVGPTKESVEIIAAGHDLDNDICPANESETNMLRTDSLLTPENIRDFMSMLSPSTRDLVRKEVHEAHIAATEDVGKEKDGTHEKTEIKEQADLSLLLLQAIDNASAEFAALDQAPASPIGKPIPGNHFAEGDLKSGSTPHKPGNEPTPKK